MPYTPILLSDEKYTITLGHLLDYFAESGKKLFDFTYDVPNVEGKTKEQTSYWLQNSFQEYYRFHEIAAETPDRFKQRLQSLWKLRLEKYGPMLEKNHANINVNSTTGITSHSRTIGEDTPDNEVNLDIEDFETFKYASRADSAANITKGYSGRTEAELLASYWYAQREILHEFLDSLDDLFLQIY